jgi:hypothetical protein
MGEAFLTFRIFLRRYSFLLSALGIFGAPNLVYWGYVTSFDSYRYYLFDLYFYYNFQASLFGLFAVSFLISHVFVGIISSCSTELPNWLAVGLRNHQILFSACLSTILFIFIFLEGSLFAMALPLATMATAALIVYLMTWHNSESGIKSNPSVFPFLFASFFIAVSLFCYELGTSKSQLATRNEAVAISVFDKNEELVVSLVGVTSSMFLVYDKECLCERAIPISSVLSLDFVRKP